MSLVSLLGLAACLVASVVAAPAEMYTTKFDNVDLQQILHNERLLLSYFNCLVDKGRCTPDGEELKKSLPDALQTACSKCSEKQKNGSEKVIRFLIEKKHSMYEELEKKYDPNGIYKARYRQDAQKQGIKV
ncbi:ejaculatory bulb-specific protein 3-like [Homalodisca vitripennis]|uniref:ejaculatory bulb-specific protein 3-like n=1 Tax=Homalodisca vitripennis TaxID=197043 RepID=UPI001EECD16E|nr:ejaculatory bulb-specific protein 3-like [Homalodisca vitripennis]